MCVRVCVHICAHACLSYSDWLVANFHTFLGETLKIFEFLKRSKVLKNIFFMVSQSFKIHITYILHYLFSGQRIAKTSLGFLYLF